MILVDTGPLYALVDRADRHHLASLELVHRYRDLPLGTVDASVVTVAERLDIAQIATVDRRDFTTVRPRHVDAFDLRVG